MCTLLIHYTFPAEEVFVASHALSSSVSCQSLPSAIKNRQKLAHILWTTCIFIFTVVVYYNMNLTLLGILSGQVHVEHIHLLKSGSLRSLSKLKVCYHWINRKAIDMIDGWMDWFIDFPFSFSGTWTFYTRFAVVAVWSSVSPDRHWPAWGWCSLLDML